jgi:hypothetical protein
MHPEIDLRLGQDTDAEAKKQADSAFNEKAYVPGLRPFGRRPASDRRSRG